MNMLKTLTAKPWLPEPAPPPAAERMPAARMGLFALLGVITALFALLAVAFLIRAQLPDWQSLVGGAGRPLASVAPLWFNTALLAAGSLALQAASNAAHDGRVERVPIGLALGALFAFAFLIGQGWVWLQFIAAGHFVASNPSASFFYLLTALHGAHLAGGLIALARVGAQARRAAIDERPCEKYGLGVALCALYWHFLLGVWLVVFALLASEQRTLVWLAEICGLR